MSVQNQELGAALSGSREPGSTSDPGPAGFDPGRMMQEFYLSSYYEPKAERPADNVRAAIEFTIDRYFEEFSHIGPAQTIGLLAARMLALAPRAGLYVGIKIEPRSNLMTLTRPSQADWQVATALRSLGGNATASDVRDKLTCRHCGFGLSGLEAERLIQRATDSGEVLIKRDWSLTLPEVQS